MVISGEGTSDLHGEHSCCVYHHGPSTYLGFPLWITSYLRTGDVEASNEVTQPLTGADG